MTDRPLSLIALSMWDDLKDMTFAQRHALLDALFDMHLDEIYRPRDADPHSQRQYREAKACQTSLRLNIFSKAETGPTAASRQILTSVT